MTKKQKDYSLVTVFGLAASAIMGTIVAGVSHNFDLIHTLDPLCVVLSVGMAMTTGAAAVSGTEKIVEKLTDYNTYKRMTYIMAMGVGLVPSFLGSRAFMESQFPKIDPNAVQVQKIEDRLVPQKGTAVPRHVTLKRG